MINKKMASMALIGSASILYQDKYNKESTWAEYLGRLIISQSGLMY